MTTEVQIFFYQFKCKDENIKSTYIGHTKNICRRFNKHKFDYFNPTSKNHNALIYKMMRLNGGIENYDMVIIHEQLCKDRKEASQIEQDFILQYNANMNKNRAYLSNEDKMNYYKDNRDKLLNYQRGFYEDHKDKKLKYQNEFYEKNRESRKRYQLDYYYRKKLEKALKDE